MGNEGGLELDVTYVPGRGWGILEGDAGGKLSDLDRGEWV